MKKITFLISFLLCISFTYQSYSQCTDTNGNGVSAAKCDTSFGQSFQPSCSGKLNTIAVNGSKNTSGHAVTIYEGIGMAGKNLGQVTAQSIIEETSTTDFSKSVFDFSSQNINVTQGTDYTFIISGELTLYFHNSNVYRNGHMLLNGTVIPSSYDLNFEIDIASTLSTNNVKENKISLKLFPNPSTDYIQLSGLTKIEHYKLYNLIGVEVKNGVIANNEKINLQNLNNGLYVLELENGGAIKFIKNK